MATRCPTLDESFPSMLPGWRAELTPGGSLRLALQVALLARMGLHPHLTLTLLARMLQGALLAQMGRCPRFSDPAGPAGFAGGPVGPCGTLSPFKYDSAGPDGLYVSGGPVGPFGTLSPSKSGSEMLVDPGGFSLYLTLHLLGVCYLRVREDYRRVRMVWEPLPWLWHAMPIR